MGYVYFQVYRSMVNYFPKGYTSFPFCQLYREFFLLFLSTEKIFAILVSM